MSSKIRNKTKMSTLTTFIQHSFASPSHSNQRRRYQKTAAVAVQLPSRVQLFATPRTATRQASLSFIFSWSLLKFMSIESVMLSNISPSVAPFFSCPQFFPTSGSFPVSWLFASGASASVLPLCIYLFRFLSIIGYDKILNIIPCAIQ